MVTFSDPRYALQWHFDLLGDIETLWQDFSGAGVSVGVYDDGMDQSHPDLAANYDASLHYRGVGRDDGRHNTSFDGHGTAVGGLIAAALNGVGGVGVAWGASLTSVDYLSDLQHARDAVLYDALNWTAMFDVVNQSYGVTPGFSDDWDIGDPGSLGWLEAQSLVLAAQTGRGGLGTIFVKAAGNDANDPTLRLYGVLGNAQGDGQNVLHPVIVVGAVDRAGRVEDYSNYGANLLVAAPAASHTTDVTGGAGYASGAYTNAFGGTSAATAVTSGVVALMLEAAPDLGWRDVQAILAQTAALTGSPYGGSATGFEAGTWQPMGGQSWNGGAHSYHPNYGFGLIDAFAAVRLAETWLDMQGGIAATDANLLSSSVSRSQSLPIRDFSTTDLTLTVDEGILIDHVYVTVGITHTFASDLTITLIAPDGTEVTLAEGDGAGSRLSGDWTYGVAALRGMASDGEWTLRVTDNAGYDIGTLQSVALEFQGSAANADDIWVFTDDFPALAAAEPARRSATDANGGTDWISTVAVADAVKITLGAATTLQVGRAEWATIRGGIENASSGDGDDVLTGGAGANVLRSGRGRDLVSGGAGADDLAGGAGGDVLQGGGAGLYHTAISAQVYRLYLAVFGREPDVGGHQAWVQRMTLGQLSHDQVVQAFIASPEFVATYGATTDRQFVSLLYQNVLGRMPEITGLNSWLDALDSGMTRARVVLSFAESPEHQRASLAAQTAYDTARDVTDWADDVYRLYRAILDRDPDAVGYDGWVNTLAAGQMRFDQVVDRFMASPEFTATYGAASSDRDFVTLLYENVLNRPPDATGLDGWVTQLETGMSRVQLVVFFLGSPEFTRDSAAGLAEFMDRLGADDVLRADGGDDVLAGGLYADQFVFADTGAPARVTVTDLEPWDVIDLSDFDYADTAEAMSHVTTKEGNTVFEDGSLRVVFLDTDLTDTMLVV